MGCIHHELHMQATSLLTLCIPLLLAHALAPRHKAKRAPAHGLTQGESSKSSSLRQEPDMHWQIREVADRALAAFVVIQAAIKRSERLQSFCQRADLLQRMPGYQVKMGFGLHVGWAIEGTFLCLGLPSRYLDGVDFVKVSAQPIWGSCNGAYRQACKYRTQVSMAAPADHTMFMPSFGMIRAWLWGQWHQCSLEFSSTRPQCCSVTACWG